MDDNVIPSDGFEIIRDYGLFKVRRNTRLVAVVLDQKERAARAALNYHDAVVINEAA
jgi:hypothetical protein